MKTFKKILTFCTAALCVLFVGCGKTQTTTLAQANVLSKFTSLNTYSVETNESFDATSNGMTGEIVVQIGDDQAPTEYLQAYFFTTSSKAEEYLKDEQIKNTYKIKQTDYASNGVTVTFGSYLNVVYIATADALKVLKG